MVQWIIAGALIVLWAVGFFVYSIASSIHLLLVVAFVLIIKRLVASEKLST